MTTNVTIPTLGKPKTVKDAIISTLSREWPLSTKKMYNRVRNNGLNVSYQAVHKAIRELLESEILVKHGREYKLNPKWINEIEEFGSRVGNSYKIGKQQSLDGLMEKGIVNLTFETFKEFGEFCIPVFFVHCPNPDKKIGICIFRHIYPMIGYSEKLYKIMKTVFSKYQFYSLCKHDTPLDRWFAEFLKETGKRVRLGVNLFGEYDTVVIGDFVMQTFFTQEFKKRLDKLYKKTKNVEEINLDELLSYVFEKKTEIKVVIFKDPTVADQIRSETLEHFKKGG